MRLLLILVSCSATLILPPQNTAPDASGIKFTDMKVKEARITHNAFVTERVPSPGPSPPRVRGTQDRTDSQEVATIKEIQNDRSKRERDLRTLGSESPGGGTIQKRTSYDRYGYEIRARIANEGAKATTKIFWAFRPVRDSQTIIEKEFYCRLTIEPGQSREIKVVFATQIINAAFPDLKESTLADIVIEHIEYNDGSSWKLPSLIKPREPGTFRETRKGQCIELNR